MNKNLKNSRLPIGVFDSGMGGLTVLKALIKDLPSESFVYYGDTARMPYGTKSKDTIIKYSEQAIDKLIDINVKMIIIACNSATVSSLEYLQKNFSAVPIVGVVKPGAQASAQVTQSNNIGLIATERTIASGCYEQSLKDINPNFIVTAKPCNIFASLAEEGHINDDIAKLVVNKYIDDVLSDNQDIDTLLLGCTHFPVFQKIISEHIPKHIKVVDSAECTSLFVADLLNNLDLYNNNQDALPQIDYYVTDSPERFKRIGELFLSQTIDNINVI